MPSGALLKSRSGTPGRRGIGRRPQAVISHSGAAALHRLHVVGPAATLPELTVPLHHHPRLAGVALHRRGPLPGQDVTVKYGVPVTSPARTLVDLAGRYELPALERALDEALIERRLNVAELNGCWQRSALNAPGRSKIQQLLAQRSEGTSRGQHVGSPRIRRPDDPPTVQGPLCDRGREGGICHRRGLGLKSVWGLKSSDGRTDLHLAQLLTENGGN